MTGGSDDGFETGAPRRFAHLLQRLGLQAQGSHIYPVLAGRYAEPGRNYHNLEHIGRCLECLDQVSRQVQDFDAAELALWFHDAVYEPGARDNELRSAFLFDRELGIHLPTARADRVHDMIMATTHGGEPGDNDACFVADIDLVDLCLPWPQFAHAMESMRVEAGDARDVGCRLAMHEWLNSLVKRPRIYYTGHFRAIGDRRARRNIGRFVDENLR